LRNDAHDLCAIDDSNVAIIPAEIAGGNSMSAAALAADVVVGNLTAYSA